MGILNIWHILLAFCEWDLEWGHELFIEYICSTRRLDLSGKEVRNCPFLKYLLISLVLTLEVKMINARKDPSLNFTYETSLESRLKCNQCRQVAQ